MPTENRITLDRQRINNILTTSFDDYILRVRDFAHPQVRDWYSYRMPYIVDEIPPTKKKSSVRTCK